MSISFYFLSLLAWGGALLKEIPSYEKFKSVLYATPYGIKISRCKRTKNEHLN